MARVLVTRRQHAILENIVGEEGFVAIDYVADKLGARPEDLMRDLAELEKKGLVIIEKRMDRHHYLTEEGVEALHRGMPEERVYRVMHRCLGSGFDEFIGCVSREGEIDAGTARIGAQHLLRHRCIAVRDGVVEKNDPEKCFEAIEEAGWLRGWLREAERGGPLPPEAERVLRRRKMIETRRETRIYVAATPLLRELWEKGEIGSGELLTVVKPSRYMELGPGTVIVKEFDLEIPPPRAPMSRLSPYMEFLDMVREILVAMGFEEVKGPHVELEFWNFDALFQAQDHPAREIHDTFYVATRLAASLPRELIERARSVHEAEWRYRFSEEKTLNHVLRSQTTAVSARVLAERGPGEYRCFSLDRVFRPETLDAKHSMEFYQLEGIIVGRRVSFRHLLAFFKEFAAALGIRDIWFKPGYFPFTEPSVEGYIKHPRLGWMEVFPGGMLRPEVLEILGVEGVQVAAWGIGIDRLAMTVLGIDDIRDLFTRDIDYAEKIPEPRIPFFTTHTSARQVTVHRVPL